MLKKYLALSLIAATTLVMNGCSDDDKKAAKKKAAPQEQKAENATKAETPFAQRDTDKDGKLSRKEYVNFARTQAEKQFAKIDSDSDSKINKKEFRASRAKLVEKLEAKGLDAKEINKRLAEQLAAIDEDGNGTLSQEEYVTRQLSQAKKSFKTKDANGNEFLSPKEFSSEPEPKVSDAK